MSDSHEGSLEPQVDDLEEVHWECRFYSHWRIPCDDCTPKAVTYSRVDKLVKSPASEAGV
jgi:hypothetical protein